MMTGAADHPPELADCQDLAWLMAITFYHPPFRQPLVEPADIHKAQADSRSGGHGARDPRPRFETISAALPVDPIDTGRLCFRHTNHVEVAELI